MSFSPKTTNLKNYILHLEHQTNSLLYPKLVTQLIENPFLFF